MSSARIPPTRRSPSSRSQPWPRSWKPNSSWLIPGGVARGWKRRSSTAREERVQPFVEADLSELDAGLVGLEPRDGANELDDSGCVRAPLQEPERALDVRLPHGMPPPAEPDQRLLRRGELGELLLRQLDVADREAPVEGRDRVTRQESAGRRR